MNEYNLKELEEKIKELQLYKKLAKEENKKKKLGGGEEEEDDEKVNIGELKANQNIEYKEELQDISERVKEIMNNLTDDGDLRFAQFKGNIGGKRGKYECPNCHKDMVVAGIKMQRGTLEKKARSGGQKDWLDYVAAVGDIPAYKGLGRRNIMKAASELRKEGLTKEQIQKMKKTK